MKKMMVSVMAIAMLASMGLGAFADYAPAAHTHNFKVVERYTSAGQPEEPISVLALFVAAPVVWKHRPTPKTLVVAAQQEVL